MQTIKFLIIVGLFGSLQAWACPNLAGNYICKDENGQTQLSMKQSTKNGVTTYRLNGQALLITDGRTRRWPDTDGIKNIAVASRCNAKKSVIASLRADVYNDSNQYIGNLEMDITFKNADNRKKLVQVSKGQLFGVDGKTYPVNAKTVCNRL